MTSFRPYPSHLSQLILSTVLTTPSKCDFVQPLVHNWYETHVVKLHATGRALSHQQPSATLIKIILLP